ncbi:unnamed protein product [Arctia plantaginis]|uniref:Uncharacterized protein n=1 Tax=Arctia plantaginis TaxID=874455 RepID=A0A8S0ZXE4_ARCPL|nr:unnamed protein product [Arctia plantaginis]
MEAVIKISKHNGRDKSVNLALETVFEFGNDDKQTDVNILNKVQRFIGKVKNVIENSDTARRQLSNANVKVFSNFIIDVIQILIEYDDRALENIASIISEEMIKHQYDGCKFYELTDNIEQQKAFAKTLREMKYKEGTDIRDDLKAIASKINEEIYAKPEKELIDVINSVYQDYSIDKLNNFLKGIDDYRQNTKEDHNITKVISVGLKTILFDHYTNLTIHLRTSLLSKLQDYMKYYNENFAHKAAAVTKQALRTLRQVYIETESHDENVQVERASKSKSKRQTTVSQRPLNVPTTRKLKSEYSKEISRNKKSDYSKEISRSKKSERHQKKHRFVKVTQTSEENPTITHKKRSTGTTKEFRTLRQMYVEKNIDLKYDPEAYEHLTTVKKSKSKKYSVRHLNSPITRKRTHRTEKLKRNKPHEYNEKTQYGKQRPKAEDSSRESTYNKNDKSVERVLTDLVVDFSSEAKSTMKIKLTKMARLFGQTFIDKDLDYNENIPEFRTGKKKLTFKTLYPTFVIDWTTPSRYGKRQFGGMSDFKVRLPKHGRDRDRGSQMFTHQPGSGGGIKLVKDLDYSIEVRKPRNLELGVHKKRNSKSSRYQSENQHESKKGIPGGRLKKVAKHHPTHYSLLQRHGSDSVDEKSKMSRDPMILARQYDFPHHVARKQFRRQFPKPLIGSEEGLSIEELKANTHKIYYRRNYNPNTTENFEKNKHVLQRIENLENELELVKIRLKNDTYPIKVLNNNESNIKSKPDAVNSNIRTATPITTVTIRSTSKIYENTGEITELKRTNADGSNKDILERKEKDNHIFNQQSGVMEREFIERKYDDYQYKSQSNTTKIVKEAYTFDPVNKDQGRKAYPSLEKAKEFKTEKDERNIKVDETNNSKNKKRIENGSIESNIQKSVNEINKKDEETVSHKEITEKSFYFRNNEEMSNNKFNIGTDKFVKNKYSPKISHIKDDTFHNQSDTKLDNSWVEVVYRERQFKNKNEENQAKENEIKDDLKPHTENVKRESKNPMDRTGNLRVYEDFVFRATDQTKDSHHTTLGGIVKNHENIFKGNEETTENIIAAIEKTVRKQTLTDYTTRTVSESSDTNVKQNERITDMVNQKEEKNTDELNTTALTNVVNDTLTQKSANKDNTMTSNVTVNLDN